MAAPEDKRFEFVVSRLRKYGYEVDERAKRKIKLAINYAVDLGSVEREAIELTEEEKKAITYLIEKIKSSKEAEEIQGSIFDAARKNGIPPRDFFKTLYKIFLGRDRGPRLGPYIWDLGKERAIQILEQAVRR